MEEQITFMTATFGGFEKKQVLDYIYKMHEEVDTAQLKHRKKLEEISVAFKDLERRAQVAEKQSLQLEKELDQVRHGTEKSSTLATDYENTIVQLEQKVIQYERILSQRKQQSPSVDNTLELQNLQRQQQKIKAEYQRMEESAAKIGRVMLEAHAKAERVGGEAEKQAALIIQQAQEAVEAQRHQINQVIAQHREKVQQESGHILARAQQEAKDILALARGEGQRMVAEADGYSAKLRAQVEQSAGTATQQLELLRKELDKLTHTTSDSLDPVAQLPTLTPVPPTSAPTPAPFDLDFDFTSFDQVPPPQEEPLPVADEFPDPLQAAEAVLSSYGGPDFDFELPPIPSPSLASSQGAYTPTPVPSSTSVAPSSPPQAAAAASLDLIPDKKVEYDLTQTDFPTIQYAPSQLQEELNRQEGGTYPSLNPPENL